MGETYDRYKAQNEGVMLIIMTDMPWWRSYFENQETKPTNARTQYWSGKVVR